jgi:hypothetical protein
MSLSFRVRSRRVLISAVVVFASVAVALGQAQSAFAVVGQISIRSLLLQQGSTGNGGSQIGGLVNHAFTFTVPSVGNANIGSIQFQYCTTASVTACTMPLGLVTTGGGVTLSNQTGATGFTLVNTTNGSPYITRTGAAVTAGTALSYTLSGVTNPTPTAQTFYVRITTYTAAALGGTIQDQGSVAAATTSQIVLTGTMPESLVFCAGATVGTTGGVPDCTTATSGSVTFNQLFSPTDTATATSQMAASTNASTGYIITVNGLTLTAGGPTIPGMATLSTGDLGVRGVSGFGLNLKLNTTLTSTVAVGAEISAASNGGSLRGQAVRANLRVCFS